MKFHIGDVLSITTGRLVSRDHIGGVYNILNHMTGESLMTHQLPRASREAEPYLLDQFPELREAEFPDGLADKEAIFGWVDAQAAKYGEWLDVQPIPEVARTPHDPLGEAVELMERREARDA